MRNILLAILLSLTILPAKASEQIRVALDWTPNTNHVGLYVAQAKGWFEEAGLSVDILPYTDTSPTVLVSNEIAEFGILAGISFHTQRAAGSEATAVMAIVQRETGRIVFNGDREDIQRPADLDGMTYGGFGTDWEAALIASIIQHDGGKGDVDIVVLGTSAYEALDNGSIDFTLEIKTWEGVNAVLTGRAQRGFEYADYGVPMTYTTYLGGNSTWLEEHPEASRRFVQAVQRGYAFALENPETAAQLLIDESDGMLQNSELVIASMQALVDGGYLKNDGEPVGYMDSAIVRDITDFLFDAKILRGPDGELISQRPETSTWFTNEFLTQ